MSGVIERLARALCRAEARDPDSMVGEPPHPAWHEYRQRARCYNGFYVRGWGLMLSQMLGALDRAGIDRGSAARAVVVGQKGGDLSDEEIVRWHRLFAWPEEAVGGSGKA